METTLLEVSTRDSSLASMQALVYHGPGKHAWEAHPRPAIRHSADAVVRITTTTICGSDLHILKEDAPTVTEGRILGHEGVGVIDAVGAAVSGFHKGDKVLISCMTACAKCDFSRKQMYSHCRNGGWILGNTIDGTQAEYARIPRVFTCCRPTQMKKHRSCSATSCPQASSAES